jgi:magnesium-transporting ATPase (P-type)
VDNNDGDYFVTDPVGDFTTSSGTVYDSTEQTYILGVVQAGYYLMIVCAQACHVFVCRTSLISVFEHGIFDNWITDVGVLIAVALGCTVVYTPFLQDIDEAEDPMSIYIFYGTMMAFGGLWGWSEGRKLFSRNYPDHPVNHALQW